MNVGKAAREA